MSTSTQEEINTSTSEVVTISTQENSSNQVSPHKPNDAIYELCNNRRNKLMPFLNNNSTLFEKLARSFAWEINTNDKLRQCNQKSMIDAFYKCCEYGLDPNSALGEVWIIPYKGNIDFQIGYRGWLKLLWNSPQVSNVYSYAVYEDDEFSYELGMNPNIKHIPAKDGDRSLDKLVATYGVVKLNNGEAQVKVCYRNEIEESKSSSKGLYDKHGKPTKSPWHYHYEAMALVVPIRRMAKNLGLTMRSDEFDDGVKETQNIRGVA